MIASVAIWGILVLVAKIMTLKRINVLQMVGVQTNRRLKKERKMEDLIRKQDAINIVWKYNKSHMVLKGKPMLGAASIVMELEDLPPAQPERWDTCFSCPLSHGCPVIKGCTNDQAEQYAGEIPTNCPMDKESAQQWIPRSERLPEKNMWVMVTCFGLVTTAYLGTKDDGTDVWRNWCGQKQSGITAWMPLPAPWKGEPQ